MVRMDDNDLLYLAIKLALWQTALDIALHFLKAKGREEMIIGRRRRCKVSFITCQSIGVKAMIKDKSMKSSVNGLMLSCMPLTLDKLYYLREFSNLYSCSYIRLMKWTYLL